MFYLPTLDNLNIADPLNHKYTLHGFYNKTWFNSLKERVEHSPFKGYIGLRLRKNGAIEIHLTTTVRRFNNRLKAYPKVFDEIKDMIDKAYLQYKQDIHDYMYGSPVRDYTY